MRRDLTRIAIVSAILFAAFFGLLLIVTRDNGQGDVQGEGKFYRLTHAVVDGSLGTDGALTVSERISFEFHGNFSGAFRDIPLADNQTFEEIGVREGATDYDSGASTELGGFGLPDTFGAVATFDESGKRVARIVWHFTASDETRTFQIHYRIRGLTRVHNDAVNLFWQVWGDNWKGSLDQLDATLTIPAGVAEGSERIWGHPASVGGTVQRDGRKITLAASGIPRNQFVELRTLLPRTALAAETPGAQVVNDDAFSRIVGEEQADFDNSAAGFRKLQRVLDNRPLVALAVTLAGLAAAIVLYGLAWLLYGREPEGEDSAVTYFPEPPDDAPPAVALALTNQGNPGPGDGDALAATLLDLIVRGRFKTRVGDGEHGPDLLLEQGDASIPLADHETPVVAIVESVLKDEPIPLSALGDRLGDLSASQRTSNASRKSHFISARGRLIKAERKQFRVPRADAITRVLAFIVFGLGVLAIIIGAAQYATHPAWNPLKWILIGGVVATFGFLVLTAPRSLWVSTRRESLPRIARWEAFRRYLEELPRLSDESPITLGTWEKLLVYATAFGCAERVAEAARLRVGEVATADSHLGTSGALLYGPWSNSVMAVASVPGLASSTSLYSDLGHQVSAGATAPSSSSSGGGGGSFGGGGGGGGGGWRRRLVGGQRPGAALGEVDDRLWPVGRVATHVGAGRVELPLLQQRVEDAEVRCRVEPGAGHPLPVAGVGGQVAVDQVPAEPALAAAPVDQQVLDEEAGADHPHAVRHESLRRQLPHAGIDQAVAGLAPAPRLEVAVVVAPRDPLVPRVDGAIREVGVARAGTNRNQSRHRSSARHLAAPASSAIATSRRGDTTPRCRSGDRRDVAVSSTRSSRRGGVGSQPGRCEGRDGGGRLPRAGRPRDADRRDRAGVRRVGARPPDQLVRHAHVVGVQHETRADRRPTRASRRRANGVPSAVACTSCAPIAVRQAQGALLAARRVRRPALSPRSARSRARFSTAPRTIGSRGPRSRRSSSANRCTTGRRVRRAASSMGLSSRRRSRRYQAMTGSTHWLSHALMGWLGDADNGPDALVGSGARRPPPPGSPADRERARLRRRRHGQAPRRHPRAGPARRHADDRRGAGDQLHRA